MTFTRLALLVAPIGILGCLGPLDTLGNESVVTRKSSLEKAVVLEDDRIEDKHPVFDPDVTVIETFQGPYSGCTATLNKSAQVTRLSLPAPTDAEKSTTETLYPNRTAALTAINQLPDAHAIPSMEVVNGALKPFNDGLYAAMELAMQKGVPNGFVGKRALLRDLLTEVLAARSAAGPTGVSILNESAAFLATALTLGNGSDLVPPELATQATAQASAFKADQLLARPIGFYTWTSELEAIFTQDRFLQGRKDDQFRVGLGIAAILQAKPSLQASYATLMAFFAGMTNPYVSYDFASLASDVPTLASLEDPDRILAAFLAKHGRPFVCTGTWFAFLPASRSKDTNLYETQYCENPPGPGVNLMDVLINAIKSGLVDPKPGAGAGFYDYQFHALETLLNPDHAVEKDHLLLTAAYKQKLIDTFKSILIQNRETHVKQLAMGAVGTSNESSPPIDFYPQLPVEPFPTFYLRSARAYRFLFDFLTALPGTPFGPGQYRLMENGTFATLSAKDELRGMTELLYGLYALSGQALGMKPEASLLPEEQAEYPLAPSLARAAQWLARWQSDSDVLRDPRVILPIGTTLTEQIHWAVIGVKVRKIRAEFVAGHEPKVISSCWSGKFIPRDYHLLTEETVEVRRPLNAAPLTREEFRTLCDTYKTKGAILKALQTP